MWPSIYLIFIFSCQVLAIWPEPQSITSGNSVLWIDPEVHVTYNGASSPATYAAGTSNGFASQAIIDEAVTRAMETLFTQNIIPWKLVGRDQLPLFEPPKNASNKIYVKTVAIAQTATDNASTFKPLAGQVDESYNLTIGTDGAANITAVSSTGVLHALESFIQLFYQHSEGCIYTNMAPVTIIDAPKFSHRGLNMDVSRNWYPVADILRTIDAISWNKFNRLHIHMTDSQSWPMQIPALPDLADKGAYAAGLSYSPDDIEYIQAYAIKRGVNVIVEFDMPGHTTSIGYGYPDLIAAFDAKPWDTYCAEPPCGTLKLNSSAVDSFLETLFSDVIPRVTPYSAYFHTGGDEVNQMAYLLDDTVNSNLTSVIQPLMQKFVDRNHAQLRAAGLAPVVWEEMLLDWNLTLGDDVLVQTWQSDAAVAAVTGKGHKALAGNYNFWYLDCGKGQWLDFGNGASFSLYYPFTDYCTPFKNWRLVYSYDPLAGVPANQTKLVMGGEVHIWSEQTDPVNLDDMVWPRASAAGEVLWSGRQDASGQNRSQITASPRLAEMRERMVMRGVRVGPVQMIFCTQNNATECSL